jgi:hypothetical protein
VHVPWKEAKPGKMGHPTSIPKRTVELLATTVPYNWTKEPHLGLPR